MAEIREGVVERLMLLNDTAKLVEALRVAITALAYYSGSDDPGRANEAVGEVERLVLRDEPEVPPEALNALTAVLVEWADEGESGERYPMPPESVSERALRAALRSVARA